MDLVCWSYRMILSFQFCNNLAFAVPEPWPSQGLHFRGSFHSHPELQPSMLGISSPVLPHQHFLTSTSSSLQVLPSTFQALPPNTSHSSSALGLFTDFTGIAAIPSVALQIQSSRRAVPAWVSQGCAESVPLLLQNLLSLKNSFHLHWQTL